MADYWLDIFRKVSYIGMIGAFVSGISMWIYTHKLEILKKKTASYERERSRQKCSMIVNSIFVGLVTVAGLFVSQLSVIKDATSERKIDKLLAQNKQLTDRQDIVVSQNTRLADAQAKMASQNTELVGGKDKLVSQQALLIKDQTKLLLQNGGLVTKLKKMQVYLEAKDRRIKELEAIAKEAKRGITSSYDFNGIKRTTPKWGVVIRSENSASEAFKLMQQLAQENKIPELINICEEQKKKTPEWLTPYLFLGAAYSNIGRKDEAIKNLEYVVRESHGDPDYAKAKEFLKILKN